MQPRLERPSTEVIPQTAAVALPKDQDNPEQETPLDQLMEKSGCSVGGSIGDCDKPKDTATREFLVSLLECPCRNKLTVCPVCRVTLCNIRNLAMEKVGSKLIFPCKHALYGCRMCLSYTDKRSHENDCDFRPYFCPYPDEKCVWQGALKDVYKHFVSTHPNVITMEGTDIIFLATNVNQAGALDWTMIQSCHGRHFLLSLEKVLLAEGCQQYFAACRMIGSVRDAAEFDYFISLEANNRTLNWKSKPRSIRQSFVTYTNEDFLVLNKSTVKLFADNNNLALNIIIMKAGEKNP
ncbi:probable E3 ubiquitin-protein ligase sinah isoform X2 [Drosophila grimshawi]|uniref:probable E3 ubiquitin-protein ligase sinah isoform X2 n=1 Tax=Drosophila grimshawi TaxID=7222 RepID=UPI000C871631|nr:probable E3 ubiquitin-protein ligase sinah isoform X2 [Drosophila grimshawi]